MTKKSRQKFKYPEDENVMNCLDFSNNYFNKAVVTAQGVLQKISEIPIARTIWKTASATKSLFLTCFKL